MSQQASKFILDIGLKMVPGKAMLWIQATLGGYYYNEYKFPQINYSDFLLLGSF